MRSWKFFLVIGLMFLLVLGACGNANNESGGDSENENNTGENNAAVDNDNDVTGDDDADYEELTITFSHNQPIDSPEGIGAAKFQEIVEEKSGGKIKVDMFPASQLGSLREQVEGTQLGDIDITMQPSAYITPFVDDVKVLDLPYLWPADYELLYEVLDSEAGEAVLDVLEQGGFKGLGHWPGGFKLITTNKQEIHEPADFKGLDIRVMTSPLLEGQYKLWGANPTIIEYAEVYNSLQQGVVDGQENPLQTIYLNNYHEVQDNVIESYHGIMSYMLIANKSWYDGLPDNTKALIKEAEEEGRKAGRIALEETEDNYRQDIIDSGINYYELTEEEIGKFKEISEPFHKEVYGEPHQLEILQKIYDKIDEVSQ